ncbi:TPA: DUF551 domain-containing protein [Klebsiella pneumoniae]
MSEFSRETLLNIIETDHVQCGEASALARMALAAMDSESGCLPLDYLQGHKEGLEWAAQLAEASHPETGDWFYDDPIELAKAIRKGPDMPPAQPVADSESVAEVVSIYGDPEAFGEREIRSLVGIQQMPYGTKLYRHAQSAPVAYSDFESFWSSYIHPLAQDDELKGFAWGIWNACVSNSQPAPVVPEEMPCGGAADDYHDGYQDGWNACRAAMLNPDKARKKIRVIVLGASIGAGFDATASGYSPAQSDCCPAQNHVSPEQNGDTPAQSQGWIPVSEQMPPSRHEVLVGRWWGEKPRWCCKWATYIPGHPDSQSSGWLIPGASWTPTHWMPLPAAPQEVKGE